MQSKRPATKYAFAVMAAVTAALFGRSWLQMRLLEDGLQREYAADLSYLVFPPIFLLLALPVFYEDRAFLVRQFRPRDLSLSMIWRALAIGFLVRILWWAALVAGIAFGVYQNENPRAVVGPLFSFQCPPANVMVLGFLVMAVLVPTFEELSHRAYVQSAMRHHGPFIAIAASAGIFAVFHPPSSWLFTFFAGVIFGIQYWNSGTLWPSLITHATVNGLIQIDWRCLHGIWNPPVSELPLWRTGIVATSILLFASISIFILTVKSGECRDASTPRH
jgi:membrane protease YdiL (CAAX protease family)